VSDFGLSRESSKESATAYYSTKRGVVPLRWTAPESLSSRRFSTQSDIWSFGIFCSEVFNDGAEVPLRVFVFWFVSFLHN
jgi:serine/threonine protein kinase